MIDFFLNHVERALSFLTYQFKDSERLKAIVRIFSSEVQELDNAVVDTAKSSLLKYATGATLEKYGKIVGVKKGTLEDHEYRSLIRAKVASNISEGTINETLKVYDLSTGSNSARYWPHYPAGAHWDTKLDNYLEPEHRNKVIELMDNAIPAGVSRTYTESLNGAFQFDSEENGFGSTLSTRVIHD